MLGAPYRQVGVDGSERVGERGAMGRGDITIWCIGIGHVLRRELLLGLLAAI